MRRYMLLVVALGLSGLLVSVGSSDGQGEKKSDQDKFQGTWLVESLEFGGLKIPEQITKEMKLVIAGTKGTFHKNKEEKDESSFALDPTKTPKTIDLTGITGPNKGKKMLGIYHFVSDDAVKVGLAVEGDRPTKFATKDGSKELLFVLKRAKAK